MVHDYYIQPKVASLNGILDNGQQQTNDIMSAINDILNTPLLTNIDTMYATIDAINAPDVYQIDLLIQVSASFELLYEALTSTLSGISGINIQRNEFEVLLRITNHLDTIDASIAQLPDTYIITNAIDELVAFKPILFALINPSQTTKKNGRPQFVLGKVGVMDISQRTALRRFNVPITSKPNYTPKSVSTNVVTSSLRRIRGVGSVAPKKKGAV